jgi:hypothetical protein
MLFENNVIIRRLTESCFRIRELLTRLGVLCRMLDAVINFKRIPPQRSLTQDDESQKMQPR